METRRDQDPVAAWFDPLAGWEAAARWNRATFDWMAKGWQQWVALVTTVPPHWVSPREGERASAPAALAFHARAPDAMGRAVAKAEPKRPARRAARKKTAPKAAKRG